jgi:hypothetical protein
MWSKNKDRPTAAEQRHIDRIKAMRCIVCDKPGTEREPTEAHEIEQGQWFTSVPLCADCHRGSHNGIHGEKRLWNVLKLSELGALNLTVKRLMEAR